MIRSRGLRDNIDGVSLFADDKQEVDGGPLIATVFT